MLSSSINYYVSNQDIIILNLVKNIFIVLFFLNKFKFFNIICFDGELYLEKL